MIGVLGPGGVGGLLAGALSHAGEDVLVLARESTAARVEREGLRVRSPMLGDFTARPRVAVHGAPDELLIVATKAEALPHALERVEGEPAAVLPLLNGLDHMALLRARFGSRTVAGSIRVQARRAPDGEIVHASSFAEVQMAPHPQAAAIVSRLRRAGLQASVDGSEAQVLWSKLARLCSLACTTSAHDLSVGEIRERAGLRAELEACVSEVVAVARAEGAQASVAETMTEIDELPHEASSSLRRDVQAGRRGELDAIAGAVIRAGDRHGLRCPTVAALAAEIEARVRGQLS